MMDAGAGTNHRALPNGKASKDKLADHVDKKINPLPGHPVFWVGQGLAVMASARAE